MELETPMSTVERPPFPNMYYSRFALPFDPDASECNLRILKEYIGKKGHNFIKLTSVKRAKYLWYAKEYKAIEVYAKTTKIISRTITGLKILLAETVLHIYTSGNADLQFEQNLLKWCADIWKTKFSEKTFYMASTNTHLHLEMFSSSLIPNETI
jgi:hypothetical protein